MEHEETIKGLLRNLTKPDIHAMSDLTDGMTADGMADTDLTYEFISPAFFFVFNNSLFCF